MNTATSHNADTLATAHALINEALKTATNEEARALLDQRRELNIISRDIDAAKRQAELDAAHITLTRGELNALYTIDGGEPISGAELDELNEGDQDTRAAIRAAYHGESYEGQGASVELYTEPAPRFAVKTSQDAERPNRYTKLYKAALIELEPGRPASFEPRMISDRARGVARVVRCFEQLKPKQLEAKRAELQAQADAHNAAAELLDKTNRAKTRAYAKARGRRAALKAQASH